MPWARSFCPFRACGAYLLGQSCAERAVGGHASRKHCLFQSVFGRTFYKRIDGIPYRFRGKRRAYIVYLKFLSPLSEIMNIIDDSRFKPRKRICQIRTRVKIGTELYVCVSELRAFIDFGPAGIRQTEYARDFVERLAYRVVHRRAYGHERIVILDAYYARMSAARHKREERRFELIERNKVSFHVQHFLL